MAGDNGLYMPERIPELPSSFFDNIHQLSLQQIALEVANVLVGEDVESSALKKIVNDSLNFEIPLVKLHDNIHTLELFHGPTLAFKDIGARFMARLLAYFLKNDEREVTVLVATSGDTGSAVANGFLGVPGIKVVILYPSGKVSDIQEKQLTTLGQNITALEVKGTFDDCQKLVKQAFLDKGLKEKMILTSANSINVARLLPQSFYYFHAFAQLRKGKKNVVIAVPSGNFGNLTAGLIAKKMGLPIHKFIAATNINNIVPNYLATGIFTPKPSRRTISNAMDVGDPSNFARMMDLYDNDHHKIAQDIIGYSFTDDQTKAVIRRVYEQYHYLMDPHGAVGYLALQEYLLKNDDGQAIFLETAHPAKFCNIVEKVIAEKVLIPKRLKDSMEKEKSSVLISNSFQELASFLLRDS